jgi:hypothetical protein
MRRFTIPLASATILIGGVVAAASVGGAAERPETVPSTEPTVTTEAPAETEAPGTTEAPPASEAPGTSEAPATSAAPASTEAPATSTEGATETTDAAEPSTAPHPLVGAWLMVDASDPEAPFAASFSSDGIYQDSDPEGAGLGAWEPTGPTSAALTLVIFSPPDEGGGMITIRATIEVAADGQTFTGDYTIEAGFEGAPPGEFGPGSVTATRIAVEPMGSPVGSLDDLFGQFEGTVPADTAMTETTTAMVTETTTAIATETTTAG